MVSHTGGLVISDSDTSLEVKALTDNLLFTMVQSVHSVDIRFAQIQGGMLTGYQIDLNDHAVMSPDLIIPGRFMGCTVAKFINLDEIRSLNGNHVKDVITKTVPCFGVSSGSKVPDLDVIVNGFSQKQSAVVDLATLAVERSDQKVWDCGIDQNGFIGLYQDVSGQNPLGILVVHCAETKASQQLETLIRAKKVVYQGAPLNYGQLVTSELYNTLLALNYRNACRVLHRVLSAFGHVPHTQIDDVRAYGTKNTQEPVDIEEFDKRLGDIGHGANREQAIADAASAGILLEQPDVINFVDVFSTGDRPGETTKYHSACSSLGFFIKAPCDLAVVLAHKDKYVDQIEEITVHKYVDDIIPMKMPEKPLEAAVGSYRAIGVVLGCLLSS